MMLRPYNRTLNDKIVFKGKAEKCLPFNGQLGNFLQGPGKESLIAER